MTPRRPAAFAATAISASLLMLTTPALAATPTPITVRVSYSDTGAELTLPTYQGALSGDGKVAAYVTGDHNSSQLHVRDLTTGATTRIMSGTTYTFSPVLSRNGRFVAFQSYVSDLVPGDTNGAPDVFVHDTRTGTTRRVSVASDGTQGNDYSGEPAISADGRFVVFTSEATNFVPAGTVPQHRHIYRHEIATGATTLVTVTPDGTPATALPGEWFSGANVADISRDGRYVTFTSRFADLVAGDTNGMSDAFVRDMTTGTTSLVSVGRRGRPADGPSGEPTISADGRFVAFSSEAGNLTPGRKRVIDRSYVYVRNLATGRTTLAGVDVDGTVRTGRAGGARLSANGRYLVFSHMDPDGGQFVLLRDRTQKTSTLISVGSTGQLVNGFRPEISDDGRQVTFISWGPDVVPGDNNGSTDMFLRSPLH